MEEKPEKVFTSIPEIDGNVFLSGITELQPGDMLEVEVEEADHYDLWASPIPAED